jgi:putative membrane protein
MMYWYGDHGMSGWGWALMTIGMIVFWGVLIAAGVALFRYLAHSGPQPNQGVPGSATSVRPPAASSPETILAERYARGEIDENEYHTRLNTLRDAGNP